MNIEIIIKIDDAIRSGNGSTIESLSRRAGIGKRMVFNYLKYMRMNLRAPIEFDRGNGLYRYARPGEFKFYWENNEKMLNDCSVSRNE
jgi:predicted DNA-binding transcriptional regulator YafY